MESTTSATVTVSGQNPTVQITYRGSQTDGQHEDTSNTKSEQHLPDRKQSSTECPVAAQGSLNVTKGETNAGKGLNVQNTSIAKLKLKKNKNQFGPGQSKRVQSSGLVQEHSSKDGMSSPRFSFATEQSDVRGKDNIEAGPLVPDITDYSLLSPSVEEDGGRSKPQTTRDDDLIEEGIYAQAREKNNNTLAKDKETMISDPPTIRKGHITDDHALDCNLSTPMSLDNHGSLALASSPTALDVDSAPFERLALESSQPLTYDSLLSHTLEIDSGGSNVQDTREDNQIEGSATTLFALETDAIASYGPRPEIEMTQIHLRDTASDVALEMAINLKSEAQAIADVAVQRIKEQEIETLVTISSATADLGIKDIQDSGSSTDGMRYSTGMKDFVIIHAEGDTRRAFHYKEHLEAITEDININPPLSVDLLSNIDVNKPGLQGLGNLHDNYRNILVFVTKEFESDYYVQFQSEIVQTFGLQSGAKYAYRVLPVWSEYEKRMSKMLALKCFPGFSYIWFDGAQALKRNYIDIVKTTVEKSRREFP